MILTLPILPDLAGLPGVLWLCVVPALLVAGLLLGRGLLPVAPVLAWSAAGLAAALAAALTALSPSSGGVALLAALVLPAPGIARLWALLRLHPGPAGLPPAPLLAWGLAWAGPLAAWAGMLPWAAGEALLAAGASLVWLLGLPPLLAGWTRGRRVAIAALLVAGAVELAVLASWRWGGQAPALVHAPGLLFVTAGLAGHLAWLALMLDRWRHLELVARERWQQEAEQRELASRETRMLRQTLAERETRRQRESLAEQGQNLVRVLDQEVLQPLQVLHDHLAAGPRAAADGAAHEPAHAAARLAAIAAALCETVETLTDAAALDALPAAAPPPLPQELGFLVPLAVHDLAPSLRARVRLPALPDALPVAVDLQLFRLGLRHLLRCALRRAEPTAAVDLVLHQAPDSGRVGLSARPAALCADGTDAAEAADARDLDIVRRVARLHGGRLDDETGTAPCWWLVG